MLVEMYLISCNEIDQNRRVDLNQRATIMASDDGLGQLGVSPGMMAYNYKGFKDDQNNLFKVPRYLYAAKTHVKQTPLHSCLIIKILLLV